MKEKEPTILDLPKEIQALNNELARLNTNAERLVDVLADFREMMAPLLGWKVRGDYERTDTPG